MYSCHTGGVYAPDLYVESLVSIKCFVCMQRDANSGWSSMYPSFWSGLFAKPSPVLEVAVDADRNILYTRSENSSIQVLRTCHSPS